MTRCLKRRLVLSKSSPGAGGSARESALAVAVDSETELADAERPYKTFKVARIPAHDAAPDSSATSGSDPDGGGSDPDGGANLGIVISPRRIC